MCCITFVCFFPTVEPHNIPTMFYTPTNQAYTDEGQNSVTVIIVPPPLHSRCYQPIDNYFRFLIGICKSKQAAHVELVNCKSGSTVSMKKKVKDLPTQDYIVPSCVKPTASLCHLTSQGIEYNDEWNDFTLKIPQGAIPEGESLTIDIGVALYGPFQYPEGLRPVSPVFWICV